MCYNFYVAQTILRDNPVLSIYIIHRASVTGGGMFQPTRILVPTDMSERSEKAIRHAFDIAKQFDAEIFLLHVVQDSIQQCTVDFCIDEGLFKKLQARKYGSVRSEIGKILRKYPYVPYIDPDKVTIDVRTGNPNKEILKEAEEREIDLIVIASRGSSGEMKYFLGSILQQVLLGAQCSVLLIT